MCETHTHKKISNFTTAVRTFYLVTSAPRSIWLEIFSKKISFKLLPPVDSVSHCFVLWRKIVVEVRRRAVAVQWITADTPWRTGGGLFFFIIKLTLNLIQLSPTTSKFSLCTCQHWEDVRRVPTLRPLAAHKKKIALIDPNGGAHLHKIWIIRRRLAAFGGDAEQQQHAVCGPRATTGRRPLVGLSSSPCVSVCECVSV